MKCRGITKGQPCKKKALKRDMFCASHLNAELEDLALIDREIARFKKLKATWKLSNK